MKGGLADRRFHDEKNCNKCFLWKKILFCRKTTLFLNFPAVRSATVAIQTLILSYKMFFRFIYLLLQYRIVYLNNLL